MNCLYFKYKKGNFNRQHPVLFLLSTHKKVICVLTDLFLDIQERHIPVYSSRSTIEINSDQETARWNKVLCRATKWSSLPGTSIVIVIITAVKGCQLLLKPPDRFFTFCSLMFQLSKLLLFPAHMASVQVNFAAPRTLFTLLEYWC